MLDAALVQDAIPAAAEIDPGILDDMIARATAFVQTQTRRYFGEPVTMTEYLSGNGSRHLRLPEPMIGEPADIEERCHPGAAATTIPTTAFQVRSQGATSYLVRTDGCQWREGWEYAVPYERGYAADEVPKDIEQLIIDLIAFRLAMAGAEGLTGETIGGYSYTKGSLVAFTDGDLKQIQGALRTIDAWRRPVLV